MSNTQFESLAVLISGKLNTIIGKINDHSTSKANLSGADFTGEVSFDSISSDIRPTLDNLYDIGSTTNNYKSVYTNNLVISNILNVSTDSTDVIFKNNTTEGIRITNSGTVRINNSYNLPSTDGTIGQVLATDGNGNVIFKTLENESSDFAQYIIDYDFTTDGVTTSYTVNATSLNKVIFVELNGLIQKEGVDYTVSDKTITFTESPREGATGTIKFWGNDITSVISSKDFTSDGVTTTYTTDTDLNKVVLVEVNGLVQKQGTDFTLNTSNNSITFTETIPSGSTGTIVYV
jgi:hypothetical protein